jgi:hypothetical protein
MELRRQSASSQSHLSCRCQLRIVCRIGFQETHLWNRPMDGSDQLWQLVSIGASMADCSLIHESVLNYAMVVDELYGHYLDTTSGFVANERLVAETQVKIQSSLPPETDVDQLTLFYGNGDPNDPSNRILHRTTQGAYKARNAQGGQNHIRAAQLLLVLVFEYWESEHRARVAKALALTDRNELKVPVLVDLRHLRQDVIHHRGVVRGDTGRFQDRSATPGLMKRG